MGYWILFGLLWAFVLIWIFRTDRNGTLWVVGQESLFWKGVSDARLRNVRFAVARWRIEHRMEGRILLPRGPLLLQATAGSDLGLGKPRAGGFGSSYRFLQPRLTSKEFTE
jgi:hypothetical protein